MRIALCGIVKNEAPYLLDWIAWHRALGFTDFIIADNESDDGTTEILLQLQRAGVLTTFTLQSRMYPFPQPAAYTHIAKMADRLGYNWAAFFDADEFLMPASPKLTLRDHLASLPNDCGAIMMNWAKFGSSAQHRAGAEPVPYRFDLRGEHDLRAIEGEQAGNHFYKTILRVSAFAGDVPNPHHINVRSGFRYFAADGSELEFEHTSIANKVIWQPFRLNHYIVKSWGEYLQKKSARGTFNKNPKLNLEMFQRHSGQGYQVHDPLPEWIKPQFDKKRSDLKRLLGDTSQNDRAMADLLAFNPPPLDSQPVILPRADVGPRATLNRRRWERRLKRLSLMKLRKRPPLNW